jgi:predicted dehydrogenase
MDRRTFLKGTAAASAFTIVPRHVLGGPGYAAPSEKLNVAGVGVGGVGKSYIKELASENIIALCDTDLPFSKPVFETYPDAKVYQDFREMLDVEGKEIDGVVIGTPDHTHAIVANAALNMKKHVYCAKPLTKTIEESRYLTKLAKKMGVATQMSTQSDAAEGHRLAQEWIWDGAIGEVHEVHVWSNRPIWPQGIDRPQESPDLPKGLDWDLWIGPAEMRPYHPAYHPFKFRGWYDFGTGALGDMGCHQFNPIIKVLRLGQPTSIYASSTKVYDETYPKASIIYYDFPARDGMPPVKVTWYDGDLKPERPKELEPGRDFGDWNGGILFVGSKGKILSDAVCTQPRIIPEEKMKKYTRPPKTLERSIGHYQEWIRACKGGERAGVDFEYGGPLTELVLLGNQAVRLNKRLDWDGEKGLYKDDEANKFISQPYYNGWELK